MQKLIDQVAYEQVKTDARNKVTLTVECQCPPIPDRQFDWAVYEDPEGVVGRGATEAEARENFWEQWDAKYDSSKDSATRKERQDEVDFWESSN